MALEISMTSVAGVTLQSPGLSCSAPLSTRRECLDKHAENG